MQFGKFCRLFWTEVVHLNPQQKTLFEDINILIILVKTENAILISQPIMSQQDYSSIYVDFEYLYFRT